MMNRLTMLLLLSSPLFVQANESACKLEIFSGHTEDNSVNIQVCLLSDKIIRYQQDEEITHSNQYYFDVDANQATYSMGAVKTINMTNKEGLTYSLSSGVGESGEAVAYVEISNIEGCADYLDLDSKDVRNNISNGLKNNGVMDISDTP